MAQKLDMRESSPTSLDGCYTTQNPLLFSQC